jgi:glucose/arabinose dehydrogenase
MSHSRSRTRPRRLSRLEPLGMESLEHRHVRSGLPAGFESVTVASGLVRPSAMDVAADGRIFVAEKQGSVRIIKDGAILATPFATVAAATTGEYGLVGITLDPDFAVNGHVYVYYTSASTPTRNVVERFTAAGDAALPGSRVRIFTFDEVNPPGVTGNYHIGGALHFGGDGMLYVTTGDATIPANAQDLGTTHGKLLRIRRDGTIPEDNPFYDVTVGSNRAIWATGLRNPFSFAVHPGTGEIFVNDVGQNAWEEINRGRRAANYGWPLTEGPTPDARFDGPLYAYMHEASSALGGRGPAAIAGGVFYTPPTATIPSEYVGRYFFGDYVRRTISTLDPATGAVNPFATDVAPLDGQWPVDIDVGPNGELYYLLFGTKAPGAVMRIDYSGPLGPGAPADDTAPEDESAALPVGHALQATIRLASPHDGGLFSMGETVRFETLLPAASSPAPIAAVDWQADMVHGTVIRPLVPRTPGLGGSFTVPTETPYTRTDILLRITVTVRYADAREASTHVDLDPRTVRLLLASSPSGLPLRLDGVPQASLSVTETVVGFGRTLSAPEYTAAGGSFLRFLGWSHGGPPAQTISAPDTDTVYTARYVPSPAYVERFTDPNPAFFSTRAGGWTRPGLGRFRGTPAGDTPALAIFEATSTLSEPFTLTSQTLAHAASGGGLLVFGYSSPDDFRYAGVVADGTRLVIGRYSAAGWDDVVARPLPVGTGKTQPLSVRVDGGRVSLHVDGQQPLVHDFGASLTGGQVGLAARAGTAEFGSFELHRERTNRGAALTYEGPGEMFVDGFRVSFAGVPVRFNGMSDSGFTPVAAETIGSRRTIAWRHTSGAVHFWRLDAEWRHVSSDGWVLPGTAESGQMEAAFGVDINGDGVVGVALAPIGLPAQVALARSVEGFLHAAGTDVTFAGQPVNVKRMAASGFAPVAADIVAGQRTIAWRHASGAVHFWRLDAAWRHVSSDGWLLPGTTTFDAASATFAVDFAAAEDGGMSSDMIEQGGPIPLVPSLAGDLVAEGRAVRFQGAQVNFFAMIGSGFTAVAADIVAGQRTIAWRHTSGAVHFWRLDAEWRHVSSDGWHLA